MFFKPFFYLIEKTDDFGVIGMDANSVNNTDELYIPEETEFYLEEDDKKRLYGRGIIIFGKRNHYVNIPDNLKISCGDDFIRYQTQRQCKKVYKLCGAKVNHLGSLSSSAKNLKKRQINDIVNYGKIDKSYVVSQEELYNWALEKRYPFFCILKYYNKTIVKILGIKITITKKNYK